MLFLHRYNITENYINGILHYVPTNFNCQTLELPFRGNSKNISSIPSGTYNITKHHGKKFKNSFWIHDVPNRHAILIHSGNNLSHTRGCILVGSFHTPYSLTKSIDTFNLLWDTMPIETTLDIIDYETC